MPDIIIHKCTLHIVRRGGWSWGPDPKAFARAAVKGLGVLLERYLAELWPDGADVEVAAPVKVALPVRLADLKAACEEGFDAAKAEALGERFQIAIAQAVERAVSASAGAKADRPAASAPARRPAAVGTDPRAKLLKLLVAWLRQGELEAILRSVGAATVESWDRTLLASPGDRPFGSVPLPVETESPPAHGCPPDDSVPPPKANAPVGASIADRQAARGEIVRARIIALVVAAASGRVGTGTLAAATADGVDSGPIGAASVADVDRELPLSIAPVAADAPRLPVIRADPQRPEAVARSARPGSKARMPDIPKATAQPVPARPGGVVRRHSGKARATGGTVHSVLPFLMLGPLAKIGYLDALDAMLSSANPSGEAALFGTALAFKVLDPPERGWQRSPAAAATAALFAGIDEPASNEAVAAFARQAADFLPALDRVLADALARGHEPDAPLLLCAASTGGWLLAELGGLFPIAWADSWDKLLDTAVQFGKPRLLIPAADADGRLFARLDNLGFRFLTDAPPTRNEAWRAIRRLPHERWWINDVDAAEGPLVVAGRKLGPAAETLAVCWRELAAARRAVAPGNGGPLETSLALAAAVALADLSWNLWQSSGDTDPLLALERFGDLDARVELRADEILVKLPLGKRSMDLAACGLLGDVAGVPWLGGRLVRFSGGSPW
jgi:hypothetical protein